MALFRAALFILITIALAACQPSDLVKNSRNGDEKANAISDVWPAGNWTDGAGNVWQMKVESGTLSGTASDGSLRGLSISGIIENGLLTYEVTDSSGMVMANGTARLVDTLHAMLEITWTESQSSDHGLFHFGHDASDGDPSHTDARNEPIDLRPMPELKGG